MCKVEHVNCIICDRLFYRYSNTSKSILFNPKGKKVRKRGTITCSHICSNNYYYAQRLLYAQRQRDKLKEIKSKIK